MAPRPDAAPESTPVKMDHDDLIRKRDAFVTSMALLRNAAEECSRSGLDFFNMAASMSSNGTMPIPMPNMTVMPFDYTRAMSIVPFEEGTKKRKRAKKPKDPDAPKRPATAYLMYCQEGRATVRKALGETAPYSAVMNELRDRWNAMPQEDKQTWLDAYAKEFAGFKEREKEYKDHKAADLAAADVSVTDLAVATSIPKPASGFTAVNHPEKVVESGDEDEEEEEEEVEEEVEEPEEEEEEEEEEERESSSSLSPPPPPPKPKATPKKNKGNKKTSTKAAAVETPATEEKRKKPRAKKGAAEKEVEKEVEPETAPEPVKKGRKKRKTAD